MPPPKFAEAGNILLPTRTAPDGKLEEVRKHLTPDDISGIKMVAIDGMVEIHRVYSYGVPDVQAVSPSAAAIELADRVVERMQKLCSVLPNVRRMFFVLDGVPPPLKSREVKARFEKGAADFDEAQALIAKLAANRLQDESFRERDIERLEKLLDRSVRLKDILDDVKNILLQKFTMLANVTMLFAPSEGEALLATLGRTYNATLFSCDFDLFSHGAVRFVRHWEVKSSELQAIYVERRDTFASDFVPKGKALSKVGPGVFEGFECFDSIGMCMFHVLVGSDFFGFGKAGGGLTGLGPKRAHALIKAALIVLPRNASNATAFGALSVAIFTSSEWTKQVALHAADENGALLDAQKQVEFKDAVAYFYFGTSLQFLDRDDNETGLDEMLAGDLHSCKAAPVNPPSASFGLIVAPTYPAVHIEDVIGTTRKESARYKEVDDRSRYFAFHDLNITTTLLFAKLPWLVQIAALYGVKVPGNVDRSVLRGLITSLWEKKTPMVPGSDASGTEVVSVPFPNKELLAEGGAVLGVMREGYADWFVFDDKLHPDLQRGKLPPAKDKDFGVDQAIRALRMVFGHIGIESLSCASDTINGLDVLVFSSSGVVASLKNDNYRVNLVLQKGIAFAHEILFREQDSTCECIAGRGTCAHKRGLLLFLGLMVALMMNGVSDEEICVMVPANVLESQAKPQTIRSYFGELRSRRSRLQLKGGDTRNDDQMLTEEASRVEEEEEDEKEDDAVDEDDEEDDEEEEDEGEGGDGVEDEMAPESGAKLVRSASKQRRQYDGDMVSNLVRIFKDGANFPGYPNHVIKAEAAREAQSLSPYSKEQRDKQKKLGKAFLKLMLETGAAKSDYGAQGNW